MKPRGRRLAVLLFLMLLPITWSCEPQPRVVIAPEKGPEVTFHVEVADTPAKRELGLQYRRELALDRGMLFIFPQQRQLAFWMKNTPIALDMIFIDRDKRIVGIVEEAAPFSLETRSVPAPSQFVLEINAGLSRRYGFQPGQRVRFEGVSVESVRE